MVYINGRKAAIAAAVLCASSGQLEKAGKQLQTKVKALAYPDKVTGAFHDSIKVGHLPHQEDGGLALKGVIEDVYVYSDDPGAYVIENGSKHRPGGGHRYFARSIGK